MSNKTSMGRSKYDTKSFIEKSRNTVHQFRYYLQNQLGMDESSILSVLLEIRNAILDVSTGSVKFMDNGVPEFYSGLTYNIRTAAGSTKINGSVLLAEFFNTVSLAADLDEQDLADVQTIARTADGTNKSLEQHDKEEAVKEKDKINKAALKAVQDEIAKIQGYTVSDATRFNVPIDFKYSDARAEDVRNTFGVRSDSPLFKVGENGPEYALGVTNWNDKAWQYLTDPMAFIQEHQSQGYTEQDIKDLLGLANWLFAQPSLTALVQDYLNRYTVGTGDKARGHLVGMDKRTDEMKAKNLFYLSDNYSGIKLVRGVDIYGLNAAADQETKEWLLKKMREHGYDFGDEEKTDGIDIEAILSHKEGGTIDKFVGGGDFNELYKGKNEAGSGDNDPYSPMQDVIAEEEEKATAKGKTLKQVRAGKRRVGSFGVTMDPNLDASEANPEVGFTSIEYQRLGSAVADLATVAVSFIPGLNLAGTVTGLASTTNGLIADIRDDQVGVGETLKNLGLNLLGDLGSLIPGAGAAAKIWKAIRPIIKYSNKIMMAYSAIGLATTAPLIYESTKKVFAGGKDCTAEDYLNFMRGLTMITGGVRAIGSNRNQKKIEKALATDKKALTVDVTDSKGVTTRKLIVLDGKEAKKVEAINTGKEEFNGKKGIEGVLEYVNSMIRQPVNFGNTGNKKTAQTFSGKVKVVAGADQTKWNLRNPFERVPDATTGKKPFIPSWRGFRDSHQGALLHNIEKTIDVSTGKPSTTGLRLQSLGWRLYDKANPLTGSMNRANSAAHLYAMLNAINRNTKLSTQGRRLQLSQDLSKFYTINGLHVNPSTRTNAAVDRIKKLLLNFGRVDLSYSGLKSLRTVLIPRMQQALTRTLNMPHSHAYNMLLTSHIYQSPTGEIYFAPALTNMSGLYRQGGRIDRRYIQGYLNKLR